MTDTTENDAPARSTEVRVRYIPKEDTSWRKPLTYDGDGGWFGPGPDGAAAYPWLMNHHIVWVEQRTVYEPEPWEPADLTSVVPSASSVAAPHPHQETP